MINNGIYIGTRIWKLNIYEMGFEFLGAYCGWVLVVSGKFRGLVAVGCFLKGCRFGFIFRGLFWEIIPIKNQDIFFTNSLTININT